MSFERITTSVPEEVANKAARAAEAGHVESVFAQVAQLAQREPNWVEARAAIGDLIAEVGGLEDADIAWTRGVLALANAVPDVA